MSAHYELYDRAAQRTIGRFADEESALSFVERCVQRRRVKYLILGAELNSGRYVIVSDGQDLKWQLDQRRA